MSRRRLIGSVLVLASEGCAKLAMVESTAVAVKRYAMGSDAVPVTREHVASLPYASLLAKVGKAPWSFLVLGKVEHADLHWIAQDRAVVVTRAGRVVRTVGLSDDLTYTEPDERDPVAGGVQRLASGREFRRSMDFAGRDRYGVIVNSRFASLGSEEIEILDLKFKVVHVVERCSSTTVDWEHENHYWADVETGLIWQSVQHFSPLFPPLQVKLLKPVG